MSQESIKIPSDKPSPPHLRASQGLHSAPASLTCVLVTQLLAGIGGPLSTEVSHPGGRGIDLVVQGQLGWVKPVRDVQVAPLAHNEAAAWGEWEKSVLGECANLKEKPQTCILAQHQSTALFRSCKVIMSSLTECPKELHLTIPLQRNVLQQMVHQLLCPQTLPCPYTTGIRSPALCSNVDHRNYSDLQSEHRCPSSWRCCPGGTWSSGHGWTVAAEVIPTAPL